MEKFAAGVKINRRGHNHPGRAQLGKNFKKFFRKDLTVPKIVGQCRKYPIPYLNTLREPFLIHYTILTPCRPILIH